MSRHMRRTTVRLEESLVAQAKREAERRGVTLTALLAEGLRLVLAGGAAVPGRPRVVLPVSGALGGTWPGIDLDSNAALLDRMEGRR